MLKQKKNLTLLITLSLIFQVFSSLNATGFRPPVGEDIDIIFLENLDSSKITVFPTVIRSFDFVIYDLNSSEKIADFLSVNYGTEIQLNDIELDLSESDEITQWALFQKCMNIFSSHLYENPIESDYSILLEILITPTISGGLAVGGIQCYILNSDKENAFSFLINSHHNIFNNAEMNTESDNDENRDILILKATDVFLETFKEQLLNIE